MPVVTRSGTQVSHPSDSSSSSLFSGAAAPSQEHIPSLLTAGAVAPRQEIVDLATQCGNPTASLDKSLSILDDSTVLHAKDAKALRDAASLAISEVWNDAWSRTSALVNKINEDNTLLSRKVSESLLEVSSRLDQLPVVAMLGQEDAHGPKLAPFSGSAEGGVQFSMWLRRLEDIMRMRPALLSSEQRANFLIGHLDGVAREKIEELTEEARIDFSLIANHLKAFFESPQQRYVARQKLSSCRQEPGESSSAFANKILNLVRAATAGQDAQTQKERTLEEFVARLRSDIRYFVKLDNPLSFEQAVSKAQMVEQLLTEATADRLMHPGLPAEVAVKALERVPQSPNFPSRRPRNNPSQQTRRNGPARVTSCFNCGGLGHIASQCPSPPSRNIRNQRTTGQSLPPSSFESRPFLQQRTHAQLMACEPSSSSPSNCELALRAAQQRIAELSLSADKTIAQLDQSNARVAALLQRNEELAQSVFDSNSSCSTTSSSIPDVRILLLCSLAISCITSSSAVSESWVCRTNFPTSIFFITQSYNHSWLLPVSDRALHPIHVHTFRPNTRHLPSSFPYRTTARHPVTYSTCFASHHQKCHVVAQVEESKFVLLHGISVSVPPQTCNNSTNPRLTPFRNPILTTSNEISGRNQLQGPRNACELSFDQYAQIKWTTSRLCFLFLPLEIGPFFFAIVVTVGLFDVLITYIWVRHFEQKSFLRKLNTLPRLLPTHSINLQRCQSLPPRPASLVADFDPSNALECSAFLTHSDVYDAYSRRASSMPIFVLALNSDHSFFVTQIPIYVNGVRMLALIDTGAGITVASQSLLTLLGIFELESSSVTSAVGMAGIPVHFIGSAIVDMRIGSKKLKHKVHFTATQCAPTQACAYNLILGNDVLGRLPQWSVDYRRRLFYMGDDQLHILTCSMAYPEPTQSPHNAPPPYLAVRAASTTLLPAGTETLVQCYTTSKDADDAVSDQTLVSSARLLNEGTVFIAPAIFERNRAWLSVANSSAAHHVLDKGQHLTNAQPVQTTDGSLYEPQQYF